MIRGWDEGTNPPSLSFVLAKCSISRPRCCTRRSAIVLGSEGHSHTDGGLCGSSLLLSSRTIAQSFHLSGLRRPRLPSQDPWQLRTQVRGGTAEDQLKLEFRNFLPSHRWMCIVRLFLSKSSHTFWCGWPSATAEYTVRSFPG